MADHHLPGHPPVPLTVRRSARARRISLRISQLDGRVTLTMPNGVPERHALEFAAEKEDWIRSHLDARQSNESVGIGSVIPVEGVERYVEAGQGRSVVLNDAAILVPAKSAPRRVQRFLKELARDRLAEASDLYSARLGRSYSRLSIRDTRSRWGSCTAQGGLMYSWRLILAPPVVLQYVAAHEVAHLAEMNHSQAFWDLVEEIHGPYRDQRQWLRDEGAALHRYRFDG
ncbi:M48 family metallopeptidase [Tropicibacter sp. R16_0]|uniref:M48 family metallopeptidase n=1 Tax=Tropicibacter sp. R16_0 TaxID=2821102 RepID=UPI001ADD1291|nr:SprT family zinc-dependent metalloprotease [Tropicibacter sp. R16_0]MBO9452502.1 M48 family metallopeptidase [Tropicibacter sp. R16_0]